MKLFHRKIGVITTVIILLIGLSIGATIGLVITSLSPEYISLYQGSYANSHFRIDDLITHVSNANKIIITVKLSNTDTATHSANVTIYLYDSNGNELTHQTKQTGSIDGGKSTILIYIYNVDVSKYDHPFIEIHDTS